MTTPESTSDLASGCLGSQWKVTLEGSPPPAAITGPSALSMLKYLRCPEKPGDEENSLLLWVEFLWMNPAAETDSEARSTRLSGLPVFSHTATTRIMRSSR